MSPPTPHPPPSNKSALLLIDIQNDFLPPQGSLAVPQGDEIIDCIQGVLGGGWMEGVWDLVVASQDWHPQTHISFSSHHKHPHAAQPYTTIKVPRGVLGEHHEILFDAQDDGKAIREQDDGGQVVDRTSDSELDLDDPLRRFRPVQGVDDGQVDLNLWPDHCVQNTYGAELDKDLKVALRPWYQAGKFALVRKGTQLDQEAFSAFSGSVLPQTSPEIPLALGLDQDRPVVVDGVASESEDEDDLARFLIGLGVDRVCVVGLAMDYCVAQTALAALNKESNPFSVYIYTPAVKGVGEETTRTALRVCEGRGIGMLTTEDEMREVFGKRTSK